MALSFVQNKTGTGTSVSSITITLTSSTTAGNCLAAAIAVNNSGVTVTGITLGGSAGNWTQQKTISGGATLFLWTDHNCAGGQTSVVVSLSAAVNVTAAVYEFSGVVATPPLDQSASASGTSSGTFSSGATATTTVASEVWFGAAGAKTTGGAGLVGPSSPWTSITQLVAGTVGATSMVAGYQIVSSTGSAIYSGTETSGNPYAAAVITLKGGTSTQQGAATLSGTGSIGAPASIQKASATLAAAGSIATGAPLVFTPPPTFPGKPPNPLGAKIEMFMAAGVALNANQSFESGISNWIAQNNATLASSSAQAHSGSKSMSFTPDGITSGPGALSDQVPVTQGVPYFGSAWFYSASSWATGVRVQINWYDGSHGYLSTTTPAAVALPAATWTQATMGGGTVPPASAAFGQLVVSAALTPGAGQVFFTDDASFNAGPAWVDVTSYVMLRDLVTITNMGRPDEASTINASQLTLTLKNDGRFTPKNAAGAYYPNIVRNCQIRVSVDAQSKTGVTYAGYRFYGEIASWPPGYDISQRDTYATITASGIWRRLSQNQVSIGSAYTRYIRNLTGTSIPVAAWSMEDGSGSTAFVTTAGAAGNGTFVSAPSFAADGTSFGGSDALPQLAGSRITFTPSGGTPTNNVIRFALSVPAAGDSAQAGGNWSVMIAGTAGTIATLDLYVLGNNTLQLQGVNSGGTVLFTGTTTTKVNGIPLLVSVELTPSGGNVNWALKIIKPGSGSVLETVTGTRASASIGAVTAVTLGRAGVLQDTTVGQLGVWYAVVPSLTAAASALSGYAGESAVDRFTRLCGEFSIASTVIGSSSAAMGPQVDGRLADILQSIEDTDGGILYETRDQFGLGYRTLGSMKDQAAAVTVSHGSGALGAPLTPVYDDQLIANQWTVTNWDGYSALAVCTSGAMSTQAPPNGVGQGYAKSKDINASSDAQANTIATQLLYQGCTDEVRYPEVTFNFQRTAAAAFFASVPGLRLGDYLQITSLPSFLGGGTAKQLAWGYTETLGGEIPGWTISFNTIPEAPFESSFSPGVFSVGQAANGSVATGSAVGATVSASQLGTGAALPGTISARTIGGITQFISSATPYDWTFAVSGVPADATYFTATEAQTSSIAVGDTFTSSGGFGGPFTVTSLGPPAGGNVNVYFTPDASSVMSSGTVFGGKNGDQWVNTSGGNQVNIWTSGTWVPITWDASSVINANTITASQIAAGVIIAGVVDGTVIQGASIIADGSNGEILVYSGTPTTGNLIGSWSGAAGSDGPGNAFPSGLAVEQGGLRLYDQGSAPGTISNASTLYTSNQGKLRYIAANGNDLVLDRSVLDQTNKSMTTQTTPTIMSSTIAYLANEGLAGSEYEIEIDGTITTPTNGTSQVYNFSYGIDGVFTGINNVTFGTVFLAGGLTVAFHVRATLTVNSTGAGGTCDVIFSGGAVIQFNGASQFNLGNFSPNQNGGGTGQGSTPISQITTNVAFDTTSNHTLGIWGNWAAGGTHTGQSAITYRTKKTRRN